MQSSLEPAASIDCRYGGARVLLDTLRQEKGSVLVDIGLTEAKPGSWAKGVTHLEGAIHQTNSNFRVGDYDGRVVTVSCTRQSRRSIVSDFNYLSRSVQKALASLYDALARGGKYPGLALGYHGHPRIRR